MTFKLRPVSLVLVCCFLEVIPSPVLHARHTARVGRTAQRLVMRPRDEAPVLWRPTSDLNDLLRYLPVCLPVLELLFRSIFHEALLGFRNEEGRARLGRRSSRPRVTGGRTFRHKG